MILDAAGGVVRPSEPSEPAARVLVAELASRTTRFRWDPEREGVDLHCEGETPRGPNRARIKIWTPRAGTVLGFLYKDSVLPFSRDRFAYGAWILKGREPTAQEVGVLCGYLESGLHPEQRPGFLKRAFPFTVPR